LEALRAGSDSGEIKVRFNRADWSEFSQTDDYSFSAVSDYVDWERIALLSGGHLVWGSGPGQAQVSAETATVTPSPATPMPATAQSTLTEPTTVAVLPPAAPRLASVGIVVIGLVAAFIAGILMAAFLLLWKKR
jgi:hypothetical protein